MTQQELEDAWTRWMHRNDVTADLPTITTFANQAVYDRSLRTTTDLADILLKAPAVLFHAGLMYLRELIEDDDGLARELGLFTRSMDAYELKWSIDQGPALARWPNTWA